MSRSCRYAASARPRSVPGYTAAAWSNASASCSTLACTNSIGFRSGTCSSRPRRPRCLTVGADTPSFCEACSTVSPGATSFRISEDLAQPVGGFPDRRQLGVDPLAVALQLANLTIEVAKQHFGSEPRLSGAALALERREIPGARVTLRGDPGILLGSGLFPDGGHPSHHTPIFLKPPSFPKEHATCRATRAGAETRRSPAP